MLSAQLNTCKCLLTSWDFRKIVWIVALMPSVSYSVCLYFSKHSYLCVKSPSVAKICVFQALGKHVCSNETDNTTKQEPCCMQLTELSKIKNAIFVPLSFIYESLMIYFCKNNAEQLDDFYRFK